MLLQLMVNAMSKDDISTIVKILAPIVICLLLGALLHMPYWYYRLLRVIVFVGTALSGYLYYTPQPSKEKYISYAFYLTAFIYNPIIPLYFPKSAWEVINVITILLVIFLYGVMKLYKKN